jgi:hypothetical protein
MAEFADALRLEQIAVRLLDEPAQAIGLEPRRCAPPAPVGRPKRRMRRESEAAARLACSVNAIASCPSEAIPRQGNGRVLIRFLTQSL